MAKREVDDGTKGAKSETNMTPMIDVVFQLIIVFLCSMKFRTLDMKIEAFLPKDVGLNTTPATAEVEVKVNVKLRRKKGESQTQIYLLDSRLGTASGEGIWTTLQTRLKEFVNKDSKVKAEIDADPDVPHGDVMRTLDSFTAAELANVVFRGTQLNKTGSFSQPG
ncbi:MAG: biopolymer transporter ExbD, partial [Planctomycetes bacterium]|nr:biopolymer transporter ExbD [Planctomycetota bacterium]